jgi:hypothetical protein
MLGPLVVQLWWLWLLLTGVGVVRLILWERARRRLARSGIADIDVMDGVVFERRLALLFRALG